MGREANLSEQQYAEMLRRRQGAVIPAKAAQPAPRGMNSWETSFSVELEARKKAGEIRSWQFEGLRFRLADGAFYKPDFDVVQKDGELVLYEIKGHWRESARLRIKVAADRHPFRFIALQKSKGGAGWDSETFAACWEKER